MKRIFLLTALVSLAAFSKESNQVVRSTYGAGDLEKFSFHQPTYFVFGVNDLKMQFSGKYRLARSIPLYLAFTQLMFWDIYDNSQPFKDSTYAPEMFYRLIEDLSQSLATLDFGYLHNSNGKPDEESRSFHRLFLRANYFTKYKDHKINLNFMTYKIFSKENTNSDIINHLGFWDLTALISDMLNTQSGSLALEIKGYAGSKLIDFDRGATQLGLLYFFKTKNFNPSLYLQRFEGYSENLIDYNKRHTEYRLGLNFTF